jgi:putative endonuclease
MGNNLDLGNKGENWAADLLVQKGFEILARNYRYKKAEIDIIACKDKLLVFVEVKTRTNIAYGEPEAAVNVSKIDLIKQAAEEYIHQLNWFYDIRFDIISIYIHQHKREITHFEDAFW